MVKISTNERYIHIFELKVFNMKRLNVLFLACMAIFCSCNQQAKRAKAYHETIYLAVKPVIDSSLDYGDALNSHLKARAMQQQQGYARLVDQSIAKVESAGKFEDDTVLLHYSLETLEFYKNRLDGAFKPFLTHISQESFSDEEARVADSMFGDFTMMQSRYWERFSWAEKKFDKQFGVAKVEGK
jgi:hypothetical protein